VREERKGEARITEDVANYELRELLARLVRVLDALEVASGIFSEKLSIKNE
jgi:hypothetical protein